MISTSWPKSNDRHEATLRACQAVDFDGLIRLPARLLTRHADIRNK